MSTASQSAAGGTKILFQSPEITIDPDSVFSYSSGEFTVNEAGYVDFRVQATVYNSVATVWIDVYRRRGGTSTVIRTATAYLANSSAYDSIIASAKVQVLSGDVLYFAISSSGGTPATAVGGNQTNVWLTHQV
ncbi:hypothetical protein [Microbacterium sp. MTN4-26]|uniref:hypothetical protein n=1 Tax=unclassified Microbacterium TaxID=2609290 RepID=UPI0036F21F0E